MNLSACLASGSLGGHEAQTRRDVSGTGAHTAMPLHWNVPPVGRSVPEERSAPDDPTEARPALEPRTLDLRHVRLMPPCAFTVSCYTLLLLLCAKMC